MLSSPFLFRRPCGMSIPCALLSMNEVAWQETRGMMNIGQEASEVGVGVAPAGTVVGATSGPNSGGNTPHAIPAAAVSGASGVWVSLGGCSQDDAAIRCFFQRYAGVQPSGYSSRHHWPSGDSTHIYIAL